MSTTDRIETVEYPESDGRPMGETDTHRRWMMRILDILSHRYRDQNVYLASDLLLYFEPGQPSRYVVPDVFVVLDHPPGDRRVFKTWEEQRVPSVVFEVTSKSTSRNDLVDKPVIFEDMGVQEYFLFDPTSEYLEPPLQGFRLIDGILNQIEMNDHTLGCQTLGIDLRAETGDLLMFDSQSGIPLLTAAEDYRHQAEQEHEIAEQQRRAAEREKAERLVAESRIEELEKELKRMRGDQA